MKNIDTHKRIEETRVKSGSTGTSENSRTGMCRKRGLCSKNEGLRLQKTLSVFGALCLIAALLFSITACWNDSSPETVDLLIQLDDTSSESTAADTRTLAPTDELEITEYRLIGTGPRDTSFDITSQDTEVVIEGLTVGEWAIEAEGLNSLGTCIIEGSASELLTVEQTSMTIPMNLREGNGTVHVTFLWDEEGMGDVKLQLYLIDPADPENVDDIYPVQGIGTAEMETSLDAGSYILKGELTENDILISGFAEAIRILPEENFTCEYTILTNPPDIDGGISLVNNASAPVEGTIIGYPSIIYADSEINLEFVADSGTAGDDSNLSVSWYSDGVYLQDGLNCSITPSLGQHQIDVIAHSDAQGSWGASTFIYEAVDPGSISDLSAIQSLENDDSTYMLDGVQDILTTPDDLVITASKISDTIQVFSQGSDGTLTSEQTISDGTDMPLNGVNAIAAAPDNSYFCAVSEYDRSICIFEHAEDSAALTLSDTIVDTLALDPEVTISQLSNVVIAPNGSDIYCSDKGTDMIYHLTWDGSALSAEGTFETTTAPLLDSSREIVIDSTGSYLAAACYASSSLQIMDIQSDGSLQLNEAFSYSHSQTSGLSQIQSCIFSQSGDVYTTSNDFLAHFSYDETLGEFSFSSRIKEGDQGIPFMSGPKSFVINDDLSLGYVSSSISEGIAAIDMSTPDTLQYSSFTPCGPVDKAVLSNDKSFLYAISSSADTLHAFSVIQP